MLRSNSLVIEGISVIDAAYSQEYTYIFRFDNFKHLQRWESSDERNNWVNKLHGLTETDAKKHILTGLEYWFILPNGSTKPTPPRYKMALVTVLAIAIRLLRCLAMRRLLGWAFSLVRLLKALAVSIIAVVLMTYMVMPRRVTRLFAGWLFGENET